MESLDLVCGKQCPVKLISEERATKSVELSFWLEFHASASQMPLVLQVTDPVCVFVFLKLFFLENWLVKERR